VRAGTRALPLQVLHEMCLFHILPGNAAGDTAKDLIGDSACSLGHVLGGDSLVPGVADKDRVVSDVAIGNPGHINERQVHTYSADYPGPKTSNQHMSLVRKGALH